MATSKNIIQASSRRVIDRAAAAKERIDRDIENDAVYDQAMDELMTAPARTVAGIRAKLFALQSWLIFAEEGHELSPEHWGEVRQCGDQIEAALAQLGQGVTRLRPSP